MTDADILTPEQVVAHREWTDKYDCYDQRAAARIQALAASHEALRAFLACPPAPDGEGAR